MFSVQFSKCCFDNFLKHVWTSRHIKRFWHYSVMNFNVFITLVNSLNSFSVFSWSFRYIPGSGRQEPLLTWQHSNLQSVCWAVTDCWQFGADTRVSGHVSRPGQHGRHLSFKRILAKIEVLTEEEGPYQGQGLLLVESIMTEDRDANKNCKYLR